MSRGSKWSDNLESFNETLFIILPDAPSFSLQETLLIQMGFVLINSKKQTNDGDYSTAFAWSAGTMDRDF